MKLTPTPNPIAWATLMIGCLGADVVLLPQVIYALKRY